MSDTLRWSTVPELSADNAAEWLSRHGLPAENVRFTELGGGISNKVVLAEGPDFRAVLKQSLGQLRTEAGWYSDRERIFREAAAMRWFSGRNIAGGHIPRVFFEELSSFTFAMEAAPAGAEMWKTQLLRGEHDHELARQAGTMLGAIVSASWRNTDAERLFGDQTVFRQLRIEPYYRYAAERLPDAATYIDSLIALSGERRVSLVHGDWSPKNLLVSDGKFWAIDWEVIHYGDPSFDVGFLLNHLLLKSIAMPQYCEALADLAAVFLDGLSAHLPAEAHWVIPEGFAHLSALLLARVYGKSPAEYLDAAMRERAAAVALDLMRHPVASTEELFRR